MFIATREEHEAELKRIKELGIPFKRYEDVVYMDGVYIRRELLREFANLMELNEKLEQS